MKTHLLILIFLLIAGLARGADPFTINLNTSDAVQYCSLPVQVAKYLTITGTPNIQGMKISFTQGFVSGEDQLIYTGKLIQNTSTPGTLVLTGSSLVQDYVDAIKTITYKNSKNRPTLGVRKITISMSDVDYLPATGHFYRYVARPGISWTTASAEASSAAMMYYGLKGYLATITSQAENDFIKSKTKGVGWIGASDAAVEGDWRWVTGPEGLMDSGQGLLFWRGTGAQYGAGVSGTGPVNGQYTNWNTNEPNDCCTSAPHEEDYAHILYMADPAQSLRWNDLPNGGGTGDYYPQGYLIEWGGYATDPSFNLLTATLDLQVNTLLFKTGTVSTICEGDTITLNQRDNSIIPAIYSWHPSSTLSDSKIPNPIASPIVTTSYSVIGTRGVCQDSAHYLVQVNPKPVSLLKPEVNICKGSQISLDPGNQQSYSWSTGSANRSITVDSPGLYKVTLTGINGCKASYSSDVIVHDFPTVNFTKLDTLICGPALTTTVDITTNGSGYSLTSADGQATVNGFNVNAPLYGVYPMIYRTSIYSGCEVSRKFNLAFRKTPQVDFTINAKKCSGYNLDVSYVGDADPAVSNFVWVFGADTIANATGINTLIVPLGINRAKRDLSLKVTQDGCSNSFTQKDIKVIPNLDLKIATNPGCEPFNAEFIATNTEVVNYLWDFGDGTPAQQTDNHPFHLYQNPGYYNVKLKVTTIVTTGQGCTNEVKIDSMVHVAPIPDVDFSLHPTDCLNPGSNEVSYSGLIGTDKDQYLWDLSHFDPSEIITDPLQTKGPLKFDLKTQPQVNVGLQVISIFGCKSQIKNILLKRKPDFSILADAWGGCIPFAPNLSGKILDKVDQVDFSWDIGDGATGTGPSITHTYTIPDKKYTVTLSGKSLVTGCSNIVSYKDSLRTFPNPHASFTVSDSIVYKDRPNVDFTNTSTGATFWEWNFGDATITTDANNPSHSYKVTGHHPVLLATSNEFGCKDSIVHVILVAFDKLFPPNAFSPNAPNPVDRVFMLTTEGIHDEGYHLWILSRWDDVVFEIQHEIKGWDGRNMDGTFAPPGVYVWRLLYFDFLKKMHWQSGTVTLFY